MSSQSRSLHLAAMPFPSPQGTQAAVRAMLDALAEDGRGTALLTYAHGAEEVTLPESRWSLHRIRGLAKDRSVRSGPSARKVVADLELAWAARSLHRELARPLVVAHHVEAAAAAYAAGLRPFVFVAHTALGPELPTYFGGGIERASWLHGLLSRAGERMDRFLTEKADAVGAISISLAEELRRSFGREVRYLPLPWTVPAPITAAEKREAREELGFSPLSPIVLYTGNLDAYQGWDDLIRAFAALLARRKEAYLVVATASEAGELLGAAGRAGLRGQLRVLPLRGERDRRRAHACADVVAVPRRAPGGVPIKLLDALARGLPCVAMRRACESLALRGEALSVADDDPEALAAGLLLCLEGKEAAMRLGEQGRAYVAREHSAARFLTAFDALCGDLCSDLGGDPGGE